MAYQVKIGYAPGDWDTDSIHQDRERAVARAAVLTGAIYISRYKFPLPIKIVKVADRALPRRPGVTRAVIAAPRLRKRAEVVR